MHRLKHEQLQRDREEAERRSAEYERRAVAAFLVERAQGARQLARETARRQRDAFRAMQLAYDEFLPTAGVYDALKRARLAAPKAGRCLRTERAARVVAQEEGVKEERRKRLSASNVADLHADADGRRERRCAQVGGKEGKAAVKSPG
eukprot:gene22746-44098_t